MIKVKQNHKEIIASNKTFPAGEVNVQVGSLLEVDTTILASIQSPKDAMELFMTIEAVKFQIGSYAKLFLELPYVPYQQQDRRCNIGEAHSSKVFCDILNTFNLEKVTILDPHSDVVGALINNVEIITQVDLYNNLYSRYFHVFEGKTLVAPDVGASKKIERLAMMIGEKGYIQGFKHRDLATGNLSGFGFTGDVEGLNLIIVDDICVAGGTFLGLAKELNEAGANTVDLFVTHGVFSQGIHKLLDNGINRLYTTDSIIDRGNLGFQNNPNFKILPWRK